MTLAKTLFGAALGVAITLIVLLILPLSGITAYDAFGLPRTVGHSFGGAALTLFDWFCASVLGGWFLARLGAPRLSPFVGLGASLFCMTTGLLDSSIPMDPLLTGLVFPTMMIGGSIGASMAAGASVPSSRDGGGSYADGGSSSSSSHSVNPDSGGWWSGGDSGGGDGGGDGGGGGD